MKFEYRVESIWDTEATDTPYVHKHTVSMLRYNTAAATSRINALGADGWELTSVVFVPGHTNIYSEVLYYFKRPLDE